jgi:NADP-dependent 3-hydroxy acid dehydrogenase YdfG
VSSLDGRAAAVTGASRGIGLAIATRLAKAGARVALLARSRDRLHEASLRIGAGSLPVVCDVRDRAAVARAFDDIESAFGSVPNIVVSAAGVFTLRRVVRTTPDEFSDVIDSNLIGPFLVARAALPRMLERGSGHLILIGSSADREILPENGAYAASKFGARALWEVLRNELRGTGVHATLISPGPTDTAVWDPYETDTREDLTPRESMLRPEAVADAVHYAVTQPPGVLVEELRLSPA